MGSCLVSEDRGLNLGVVQISPQADTNGSLSILYVNGDKCGSQRYSTRIIFECGQTSVSVHGSLSSRSISPSFSSLLCCLKLLCVFIGLEALLVLY